MKEMTAAYAISSVVEKGYIANRFVYLAVRKRQAAMIIVKKKMAVRGLSSIELRHYFLYYTAKELTIFINIF